MSASQQNAKQREAEVHHNRHLGGLKSYVHLSASETLLWDSRSKEGQGSQVAGTGRKYWGCKVQPQGSLTCIEPCIINAWEPTPRRTVQRYASITFPYP